MANYVDKVIADIEAGNFWTDYNPRIAKLDHYIYSQMYIPAGTSCKWSLSKSYRSTMFKFKASLWRDGNIELDLTKDEHARLKKAILLAVEKAKEEYQQKQIRAKQYEK